eukprot:3196967-Karenia_brevis.AAC.1
MMTMMTTMTMMTMMLLLMMMMMMMPSNGHASLFSSWQLRGLRPSICWEIAVLRPIEGLRVFARAYRTATSPMPWDAL